MRHDGKRVTIKGVKDVFIIAEISANHGQDYGRAVAMIKQAKECGADAVKFQLYSADVHTLDIDNKYFRIKHPEWGGRTLYQLYSKSYTPWSWMKRLKRVADDIGIIFFSTASDRTGVDLLEDVGVPIHKIASFELVDLPLIEYMAGTKKPLLLSTGMATIREIGEALSAARKGGAKDIGLLKCVSCYPANPEQMNLNVIPDMRKRFHCPVGLSDHTLGVGASIAAVSLGARVIEKHFTLSRKFKTTDSFFSMEPRELKELVKNIKIAEKALGEVSYRLTAEERRSKAFRRSLFVIKDIKKGDHLSGDNVRSIRPSYGLAPKYHNKVLGKEALQDISKGTPLSWSMIG